MPSDAALGPQKVSQEPFMWLQIQRTRVSTSINGGIFLQILSLSLHFTTAFPYFYRREDARQSINQEEQIAHAVFAESQNKRHWIRLSRTVNREKKC